MTSIPPNRAPIGANPHILQNANRVVAQPKQGYGVPYNEQMHAQRVHPGSTGGVPITSNAPPPQPMRPAPTAIQGGPVKAPDPQPRVAQPSPQKGRFVYTTTKSVPPSPLASNTQLSSPASVPKYGQPTMPYSKTTTPQSVPQGQTQVPPHTMFTHQAPVVNTGSVPAYPSNQQGNALNMNNRAVPQRVGQPPSSATTIRQEIQNSAQTDGGGVNAMNPTSKQEAVSHDLKWAMENFKDFSMDALSMFHPTQASESIRTEPTPRNAPPTPIAPVAHSTPKPIPTPAPQPQPPAPPISPATPKSNMPVTSAQTPIPNVPIQHQYQARTASENAELARLRNDLSILQKQLKERTEELTNLRKLTKQIDPREVERLKQQVAKLTKDLDSARSELQFKENELREKELELQTARASFTKVEQKVDSSSQIQVKPDPAVARSKRSSHTLSFPEDFDGDLSNTHTNAATSFGNAPRTVNATPTEESVQSRPNKKRPASDDWDIFTPSKRPKLTTVSSVEDKPSKQEGSLPPVTSQELKRLSQRFSLPSSPVNQLIHEIDSYVKRRQWQRSQQKMVTNTLSSYAEFELKQGDTTPCGQEMPTKELQTALSDILLGIRQPAELLWEIQRFVVSNEKLGKSLEMTNSARNSRTAEAAAESTKEDYELYILKWRLAINILSILFTTCRQCRLQIFYQTRLPITAPAVTSSLHELLKEHPRIKINKLHSEAGKEAAPTSGRTPVVAHQPLHQSDKLTLLKFLTSAVSQLLTIPDLFLEILNMFRLLLFDCHDKFLPNFEPLTAYDIAKYVFSNKGKLSEQKELSLRIKIVYLEILQQLLRCRPIYDQLVHGQFNLIERISIFAASLKGPNELRSLIVKARTCAVRLLSFTAAYYHDGISEFVNFVRQEETRASQVQRSPANSGQGDQPVKKSAAEKIATLDMQKAGTFLSRMVILLAQELDVVYQHVMVEERLRKLTVAEERPPADQKPNSHTLEHTALSHDGAQSSLIIPPGSDTMQSLQLVKEVLHLVDKVARYLLELPGSVRSVDHEFWISLRKLEKLQEVLPLALDNEIVAAEVVVLKRLLIQLNERLHRE